VGAAREPSEAHGLRLVRASDLERKEEDRRKGRGSGRRLKHARGRVRKPLVRKKKSSTGSGRFKREEIERG